MGLRCMRFEYVSIIISIIEMKNGTSTSPIAIGFDSLILFCCHNKYVFRKILYRCHDNNMMIDIPT